MVEPDAVALLAALAAEGIPATVVRDGDDVIVTGAPDDVVVASGPDAFGALDLAEDAGFWTGYLAYELGRSVERVVRADRPVDDAPVPDLVLARHDARIVCGAKRAAPSTGSVRVVGRGPGRAVLERALAEVTAGAFENTRLRPPVTTMPWRSSLDQAAHATRVDAIRALLTDGDCYQVNLTRRLTVDEAIDPIALAAAVFERHEAPHAALMMFEPVGTLGVLPAVVSASPELFLRCSGRQVETRPIKGTAADAGWLRASAKNRAENVMIVDLARNDLGRVCEPGSIAVPSLCAVEAHPGLHHLVSTVTGRRRDGVKLGELLRATFPPASVTGAPKPRVLQAIEDLETVPRGVYCGAMGFIDAATARSEWAVAIRTFTVLRDRTTFGVGGGIVADSEPAGEWAETELKAARLLALTAPDFAVAGRPA
jgi:para-aminobenzoate synthetase component 1